MFIPGIHELALCLNKKVKQALRAIFERMLLGE
jgi:hypothetical protein